MADGLFKRGKRYVFDFCYKGKRHQGSTGHTNKEEAQAWLRAFRTNLRNTGVGLVTPKPLPLFTDFLNGDFSKHFEQNAKTEGTKIAYRKSVKRIVHAPCFQGKLLDQITDKEITAYKEWRQFKENAAATINGDLAVLRKALRYADKGLKLIRYPGVKSLPGANVRRFVLSGELEKEYLAVAAYPLKQVAILMLDLGLRPEEACSLRKGGVSQTQVTVERSKTVNGRRTLPQTARTLEVFKFMAELFPDSPWVFPGRQGKHLTAHAVSNIHGLTLKRHNETVAGAVVKLNVGIAKTRRASVNPEGMTAFPAEFVLYSLRHTFATRFAESCNGDANLVMKALGHSSPLMSARYIHVQPDYMRIAFQRKEMLDKAIRGEIQEDASAEVKA